MNRAHPDADAVLTVTESADVRRPSTRNRVAVALLVGLLSATYVGWFAYRDHQLAAGGSDFDLFWLAARSLIDTGDPTAFRGPVPFLYPLPAVIVSLPFTLLPRLVARLVFAALSGGLLAFALSRDGWQRLPILLSAAMVDAARTGQWSTLFAASVLLPSLGWLVAVKPNLGIAVSAASSSRRLLAVAFVGGLSLCLAAFVIDPLWIAHWLAVLPARGLYRIPVLSFGGPLLLLALLLLLYLL